MCILKNVSFLLSLAYTGVCTFYDDPYLTKTQTNYIRTQSAAGSCDCVRLLLFFVYVLHVNIFSVLTMIRSQDSDALVAENLIQK